MRQGPEASMISYSYQIVTRNFYSNA